jgi:MarR family transcriptional regulator, organic hydroperoxide resistance regulator
MNPVDQATPESSARLSRMLCFAVYSASHAFTRVYKPLLDRVGLTYPQYLVLLVLCEEDNLTVKQIGERLFLDSGTLTPLLKRLESAGFVRRVRDRQDERQVRVKLTNQGQAIEEQAASIMSELVCAIGQSEESLLALTEEVAKLRAALFHHSSS